jgi:hypothetical protein
VAEWVVKVVAVIDYFAVVHVVGNYAEVIILGYKGHDGWTVICLDFLLFESLDLGAKHLVSVTDMGDFIIAIANAQVGKSDVHVFDSYPSPSGLGVSFEFTQGQHLEFGEAVIDRQF